MTDKELVRKRFCGAAEHYDTEALVQKNMAERLALLVRELVPVERVRRVLEIGCGTGFLTRAMNGVVFPEKLYLNDICPEFKELFADMPAAEFIPGDAESVDFPANLDLVLSGSAIQWFDDPGRFFAKCRDSLVPGGFLAFSTFAPGNLGEIAEITGVRLHYPSLEQLETMLEPDFRLLCAEETAAVLRFPSAADVLRHLKMTGVNGISRRPWTRKVYSAFCTSYSERFADADGCPLTYRPVFVVAVRRYREDASGM